MSNTIPAANLRNYLMSQDRNTLVNLIINYIAKNSVPVVSNNSDELIKELQSVKDELEKLEKDYQDLSQAHEHLQDKLDNNSMNETEDAIALLWDDPEFNSITEKAVTHARNLKLKDNSPIGKLLRKLSYKITIE